MWNYHRSHRSKITQITDHADHRSHRIKKSEIGLKKVCELGNNSSRVEVSRGQFSPQIQLSWAPIRWKLYPSQIQKILHQQCTHKSGAFMEAASDLKKVTSIYDLIPIRGGQVFCMIWTIGYLNQMNWDHVPCSLLILFQDHIILISCHSQGCLIGANSIKLPESLLFSDLTAVLSNCATVSSVI